MDKNKLIIVVISGLIVTLLVFGGLNIYESENLEKEYIVDRDYVSNRVDNGQEDIRINEIEDSKDNITSEEEQLEEVSEPLEEEDKLPEEKVQNSNTLSDVNEDVKPTEVNNSEVIKENSINEVSEKNLTKEENNLDDSDENNISEGSNIEEEIHEVSSNEESEDNNIEENNEENKITGQASNTNETENEELSNEKQENNSVAEYTGKEWVDEKINVHINEITESDLYAGLSMAEKIDENIVMGYLEDGLTEEEKEELKTYLNSVLTRSEYELLKVLVEKYSYLLE